MHDAKTGRLMDDLVSPILAKEEVELRSKVTRAAEWAVQAGVPGSGIARFKRISTYFDHHKDLAAAVWEAMLRVLEETDQIPYAELGRDLKEKFDGYLSKPTGRTQATMDQLKQSAQEVPREKFEVLCIEVRSKYHTEIDLYQARSEAKQRRMERVPNYSTLPVVKRIYLDAIESFWRVREVGPGAVAHLLKDGYLDRSEDSIQRALEEILNVPFHKKDWGGELNDLYTSNVVSGGWPVATAFLLKGNGLKKRTLEIRDCGANGDQLVRLVHSPAHLFVVQFVGNVSESVIQDLDGKMQALHAQGRPGRYCIIDGQDTARLLKAYGKE
jgi:hypothetical protein